VRQNRVPLTISVPADLAARFESVAKTKAKGKSELFRDMFGAYLQRQQEAEFFELQRYGARKARRKRVLTEADVESMLSENR
jgi:metal-responsive CopG/Arc/MetJ family transcriptional regulator